MKFSELQDKQVVNVQDGTLIGRVEDLDVSLTNYQVQSFLVGRNTGWLHSLFAFLFPPARIIVCLDQVVSVGEDVILIHPRTKSCLLYTSQRSDRHQIVR